MSTRLPADTPIAEADWIPRAKVAPLARLGLVTLGDLIRHFPRRYEDRRRFDRFPDQAGETPLCLFGTVKKTSYRHLGPRRIFEIRVEDESAGVLGSPLLCRWFNLPWVRNVIATGDRIVLFGKPRLRGRSLVMEHPEFEVLEEDGERLIHFDRITPIHPAGEGVQPRLLRSIIHATLEHSQAPDLLWRQSGLPTDVWRKVHFPETDEDREQARQALVREEFFSVQIIVCSRHAEATSTRGITRPGTGELWTKVESALPFTLTASQREAIAEIANDMAAPRRMNRLLQGDVGSGKTLVALRAMLQAAESGWQSALMAPTQILAEQHWLNFQRLLAPLGIGVALLTGSRRAGTARGETLLPGMGDSPKLIVGTHALLFENAAFDRLGLVVIDEQHKFGVVQRSRLIARADAPDILVMTATPIPRTITQTLYGDLDVSVLRDKPAGRGTIVTAVRPPSKLPDILAFLRRELDAGRQAYIVYPLVDESDKLAAKAATAEFERWREALAPLRVGLVHGRLAADEKEQVMRAFRDGSIACLVSTTVIEVGVDVPNATIMLIENADRFGLSQIHQLRGRVGRGHQKSYCILVDGDPSEDAAAKLSVLEKTSDGFEIAEADLEIRGPGDILGTAQTGFPPLRLGDLLRDASLMTEARAAAMEILSQDPGLTRPEHLALRIFVERAKARFEILES